MEKKMVESKEIGKSLNWRMRCYSHFSRQRVVNFSLCLMDAEENNQGLFHPRFILHYKP